VKPAGGSTTRSAIALSASLILGLPAGAQPEAQAPPVSVPASGQRPRAAAGSMEVAAHLWAVIGRYRFAATADLVRVTLVRPGGRSDMHSMEVRCVPGPTGLARLDLGDLVLEARAGRLRAIHRRDPTTYAEITPAPPTPETDPAPDPARVLASLTPPLPIPHLSLAFGDDTVDWCPLVRGIVWQSAERVSLSGREGVRLLGASETGEALLDLAGARVRRFEADLDADGLTRIIVDCEPLEASDPAEWVLDVSGRRAVEGLGALRPLGPRIGPGDAMPALALRTIGDDGSPTPPPWRDAPEPPQDELTPLVLVRDSADPEAAARLFRVAREGLTAASRELLRARLDGRLDRRVRLLRPLMLVEAETSGDLASRLEALALAWSAPDPPPGEPPPGWFGGDLRVLDRVAGAAEGAMVLVDGAGVVRAVLALGERTVAEGVAEAVASGAMPALTPP
jgi:hypothetical protein